MTDKPYTDADVELVAGWFRRWLGASTIRRRDRDCAVEILSALATAGRLATNGRCGDVAPSLAFLTSRIRQTCRLTAGHAGWHRGDDGSEWVEHSPAVGSVCQCTCHQPDRCPCKPGAPAHRHGAGGYCTSSELAAETHHVIAFAGDGTWSLEHPTGCRTADADFDCPVRQLAERQITRELAELMSGWRFECAVSPLGDYFLLGDPLAEEQTEG